MLSRAAKDQQIKEFNAAFKAGPSVMVVEYKGLTVSEMEKLRKDVSDAQSELTVVKNTLLKIAAKDTDIEQIDELFVGPTAVAICESDPSAVAKVFVNTIKDAPQLKLKGGFVDGSVLDGEALSELSKLPSRPEMLAKIMGLLKAPMSNVVGALTQMQTKLLYALEAVKETKENEPEPKTAETEKAEEAKPEEPKQEAKEAEAKAEEAPKEEAKAEEAKSEEAQDAVEDTKEEAAAEPEQAPEAEEAEAQEATAEQAPSEEAADESAGDDQDKEEK